MNHHIIDYVHIEASGCENAQSVHFEKQRAIQDGLNCPHSRIEALDMAHLQDPPAHPCRFEQSVGFRQIHGHGLFDKDIKAHFQQPAPYFGMRAGWNRDAYRIGAVTQFLEALQDWRLKLLRNCGSNLRILIANADEFHAIEFAIHARVIAPKFARAYDGHTDPL
jgi:hypothetical protein